MSASRKATRGVELARCSDGEAARGGEPIRRRAGGRETAGQPLASRSGPRQEQSAGGRAGGERQADDVEVVALDPRDERRAGALDRVAARAALPLAGGDVPVELRRRSPGGSGPG